MEVIFQIENKHNVKWVNIIHYREAVVAGRLQPLTAIPEVPGSRRFILID